MGFRNTDRPCLGVEHQGPDCLTAAVWTASSGQDRAVADWGLKTVGGTCPGDRQKRRSAESFDGNLANSGSFVKIKRSIG